MPDCPECSGPQMLDHPAGVLMFQHSNICTIRDREDSRQLLDFDHARKGAGFLREATLTEQRLLTTLGYVKTVPRNTPMPPADEDVRVDYRPGIRRRIFPNHEIPTPEDDDAA